jgi:predicted DNA-binding antitoxin AbrB/MazE fold protein
METFTVQAVYKKGVLRPKTKLNLPENSVVEVDVRMKKRKGGVRATLFGAFPELAAITDDDVLGAKGLWEKSLRKQTRVLKKAK